MSLFGIFGKNFHYFGGKLGLQLRIFQTISDPGLVKSVKLK